MTGGEIRVRGPASREEVAAVIALLGPRTVPSEDAYERWRRIRQAALRRTAASGGR